MTPLEPKDDEQRYRIIASKNTAWDGRFVFAVRTTGIFCRPSCSARTPRPQNVEYFSTTGAALAAGYRACLRCRPEAPLGRHPAWLERVCRCIEAAEEEPRLAELAHLADCSASKLQRSFKAALGVSPKEYASALRHARLRAQLQGDGTVTGAAYGAGYGSSGRLYAESADVLGMDPRQYKQAGKGEVIEYSTSSCPLGRLLVARTQRGVCAVSIGDDDRALVAELVRQFAAASVVESAELGREMASVLALWRVGAVDATLPLDIRGTAFQHRVWQALRSIPTGQTRTYKQVAAQLGMPDAVRAVGSACAANRLALLVPCHRVLRSDGGLGGFRWGLDFKQRLLADENAAAGERCPEVDLTPGSQ